MGHAIEHIFCRGIGRDLFQDYENVAVLKDDLAEFVNVLMWYSWHISDRKALLVVVIIHTILVPDVSNFAEFNRCVAMTED